MKKIITTLLIISVFSIVSCSTQNENNNSRATGVDQATTSMGGDQGGTAETNDF